MGKPKKHKRKGPKSTRAGCLLCKPHKHQANKYSDVKRQEKLSRLKEKEYKDDLK